MNLEDLARITKLIKQLELITNELQYDTKNLVISLESYGNWLDEKIKELREKQ